jgi:CRP/FNR family transcriptional regulator
MLTMSTHMTAGKIQPKGILGGMEIFKRVPAPAMAELERHAVEKRYNKHDPIFLEGDSAEHVWFVKNGHVKAVNHTTGGRCQTLCMVGSCGMFGTCCSFGAERYLCNSVAETDTTVVAIPMARFMETMAKYPMLGTSLVASLSQRLRRSKETQSFDQEPVETRILHILVNLVEEFGNTIPLTRREIAEMAGTTVETCIRTFSKLEDEGLVSSTRGKITVKDTRVLNERIEGSL